MTARAMDWSGTGGLEAALQLAAGTPRPARASAGQGLSPNVATPAATTTVERTIQAIPGYKGYIPGKTAEMDVIGQTFAKTNQHVATAGRQTYGALGNTSTSQRQGFAPPARTEARKGQEVPGYTGHIPKVHAEPHSIGKTFAAINDHVAEGPKVKPGASEAPVQREQHKAVATGGGQAAVAIKGYTGHIPGCRADNIIGATVTAANQKAVQQFANKAAGGSREGKHAYRRPSAPGIESRRGSGAAPGKAVPGYAGYVPGKLPESNLLGLSFAEANKAADRAHKYGRGRVPREDRPSSAPSAASTAASRRTGRSEATRRSDVATEVSLASSSQATTQVTRRSERTQGSQSTQRPHTTGGQQSGGSRQPEQARRSSRGGSRNGTRR